MNTGFVDPSMYHVMQYGAPGQGMINYIQNKLNTLPTVMGQYGTEYINQAKELANRYISTEAVNKVKNFLFNHNPVQFNPNAIRRLNTVEDMQLASPIMQDYIMANPYIREHSNEVYGYVDTYQDTNEDLIFNTTIRERRVTDGILTSNEVDKKVDYYFTEYTDNVEEIEEMDFLDQLSLINTWDMAVHLLKNTDLDPTNPYGGLR